MENKRKQHSDECSLGSTKATASYKGAANLYLACAVLVYPAPLPFGTNVWGRGALRAIRACFSGAEFPVSLGKYIETKKYNTWKSSPGIRQ